MTPAEAPAIASSHRKHLRGWLSYAFASEVFAVCSLTVFLPICLEQFARDNGVLLPEKTLPCSTAVDLLPAGTLGPEARCVVRIAWLWVDSASFSLYVYSASVAIQALTVISMGGVADHADHRKLILLGFAALGSFSATLFLLLPSSSPLWFLCALLAIIANVSFGASIVALNAYLPLLARSAPEVAAAHAEIDNATLASEEVAPRTTYSAILSRTTSRISSNGIAIGYAAGITLLLVSLVPVTLMKGSTFSLRIAIGMSGIWWATFTIPAAAWLPGRSVLKWFRHSNRPITEELEEEDLLPSDASEAEIAEAEKEWTVGGEIKAAWWKLGLMIRPAEVKRLRNTFWYLAAWFLLSDGFSTIASTAVLFAKTSLNMPATSLILIGVLTPCSGIVGSLLWPRLQKRLGWTNLRTLAALILIVAVIPIYGCLGFIPWLKQAKFGGLTTKGEMFFLAVFFGSVAGPIQSYARSVFAELIPPGEEARWYGLYSITDKSSSFLGPLVVGMIADATGNIRFAFFFLIFMVLIPVPILLLAVDVDRGRSDAATYAEVRDRARISLE